MSKPGFKAFDSKHLKCNNHGPSQYGINFYRTGINILTHATVVLSVLQSMANTAAGSDDCRLCRLTINEL